MCKMQICSQDGFQWNENLDSTVGIFQLLISTWALGWYCGKSVFLWRLRTVKTALLYGDLLHLVI